MGAARPPVSPTSPSPFTAIVLAGFAAVATAACTYRDGVAPTAKEVSAWLPLDTQHGALRAERGEYGAEVTEVPTSLTFVTFNVLDGGRLDAIATAFATRSALATADVILLQEVQREPGAATSGADYLARRLGMHFVFAPARIKQSGEAHGLAVLSRYPITDARVLHLQRLEVRGRHLPRIALAVRLDIAGVPLWVFDVHLDTRINHRDRIEQLDAVVDAAASTGGPVVVGGDMNTNSVTWLRRTYPVGPARQAEAVDSYMTSRCFDTPTAASGPTSRDLPLLQHRLDSLFTRQLDVIESGVEHALTVSDHLPVWIEVMWRPERGPDVFHRCPMGR